MSTKDAQAEEAQAPQYKLEALQEAVQTARADVVRLMGAEVELSHRRRAQLFEIRGQGDGGCALAGDLTGDPGALAAAGERVTQAAGEVVAAAAAIAAARRAREAAIQTHNAVQVGVYREEAAQLRNRADGIDQEGAPHREALRELYGEEWMPASAMGIYTAATAGSPVADPSALLTTIPEGLRRQAADLEARAAKLETQGVPRRGQATGADAAAVYEAVAADPFRIGPTLDEVHDWAAQAEAPVREAWRVDRLSRHRPVDDDAWRAAGPQFVVSWDHRGILAKSSYVTVPMVERDEHGVVLSQGRPQANG